MNILSKHRCVLVAAALLILAAQIPAHGQNGPALQPEAEQLMALANQARAAVGAPLLHWDRGLAEAARKHTLRMVAEGPIAHQYSGELDVSERAGLAGAHFDLIEENVAVASTLTAIHDGWMQSKGHRENLLNPQIDSVGIAIVASRGVLYATADYSRGVQALTREQVESLVSGQIQSAGMKVRADHSLARAACLMNNGIPRSTADTPPGFVMRWEGSDLTRLPQNLVGQLKSGRYREAAVGSCDAHGDQGTFTSYRVTVLLY